MTELLDRGILALDEISESYNEMKMSNKEAQASSKKNKLHLRNRRAYSPESDNRPKS